MKKQPTKIPVLISRCNKYDFILDEPENLNSKRHVGTCICGTRGTISVDSFRKEKVSFCRNINCIYYQNCKRLCPLERTIIAENKKCTNISHKNKNISFTCECGFSNTIPWVSFNNGTTWCARFSCINYRKSKRITTEMAIQFFTYEGYSVQSDYKYEKISSRTNIICPKNHTFNCSIEMWKKNSRCMICKGGNKRSLSYQQLVNAYANHGCTLLYNKKDYTGNVTKNIVPYKCSLGHIVSHLTKNNFNIRINSDSHPCTVCSKKQTEIRKAKRVQKIIEILHNVNCTEVKCVGKNISYTCSCGTKTSTDTSNVQRNTFGGCTKCSNQRRDNILSFKEAATIFKIGGEILPKQTYVNNKTKLHYMCSNCSEKAFVSVSEFKRGRRCSSCSDERRYKTNIKRYGTANAFASPIIQEKIRQINLSRYGVEYPMQNPAIHSKAVKSAFATKKYTMPSGKIVNLQGYEPRCMDILLDLYEEDQILSDSVDMPNIWYKNPNRKCEKSKYIPDMFIPHLNLVIEVKSTWTRKLGNGVNDLKFKKVAELGHKLIVYVFNEKILTQTEHYEKDDMYIILYNLK